MDKEVTARYMNGVSYRKVVEILARRIQSSLSPMTSWRALQRVGEKVRQRMRKRKEAPPHKVRVVALGGYELRQRVIEVKVSTPFLRMPNAKIDAPGKS